MTENGLFYTLQRSIRVADQSCTAYSILRDDFRRRSTFLDISILLLSTWLTAMVFVQPNIAVALSPHAIPKDIWLGLLCIGTFFLSLIQLQVNWKGRSQVYQQAATALSTFTKEHRPLGPETEATTLEKALLRYQFITDTLEPIPESKFLKLKQKHKIKVAISKHLDSHPGASILMLRMTLWWRDSIIASKPQVDNS